MKISTNAVQELTTLPEGIDTLISNIGQQLGAVEAVVNFGAKFQGALIVKVVTCVAHENSDHLHICRVDDAGVAQGVERDEDGLVQVVCGAPNVHAGMLAVWLPPGSTVPDSFDTEPFVLGARELRGVLSNGMLASAKELALGEDHGGILEIEDKALGQTFADAYGLNDDIVIDIENKMFTHRPDCFGYLGVVREIAGIHKTPFKSPDWYSEEAEFLAPSADVLPLAFENLVPELVPRFMAVTMANVKVQQSPVWLRVQLVRHGLKPINNIVDFTNFYMVLTGQPLHAYDYDKVKKLNNDETPQLFVRHPNKGETLALLNGKTIEPRAESILVATAHSAIAVGGVMGGSETEVDEHTQNIILECANFDMYNIRRTSMAHGLFTDAVTRFNKGQSPRQTRAVLNKIVREMQEGGFATVASDVIDNNPSQQAAHSLEVTAQFINERLGLSLQASEMKTILENVEFVVEQRDESLIITVPFWRTDIAIAEDIVEEVGRLHGFEQFDRSLPVRSIKPVKPNQLLQFKTSLRRNLARLGANELLTYSFVHSNVLTNSQQNKDLAFKINNALSPDLQYYRLSLTPSLLANVHSNTKAGYGTFTLFEIGKTHNKMHVTDDNDVPKEYEMVVLTCVSSNQADQPAYYDARNYLHELAAGLGIELEYRVIDTMADYPVSSPFDFSRSSLVFAIGTDICIGIVGEYKSSVRKKFKLPASCAGFEIGVSELIAAQSTKSRYTPLSRFPHVSQDICLQVSESLSYHTLTSHLSAELLSLSAQAESITWQPIDIYTSDELGDKKRITYRVTLTSYERTLSDAVLSKMLDSAAQKLHDCIEATRI